MKKRGALCQGGINYTLRTRSFWKTKVQEKEDINSGGSKILTSDGTKIKTPKQKIKQK